MDKNLAQFPLNEAIPDLLRINPGKIRSCIRTVEASSIVGHTRTKFNLHFLAFDGNQMPKTKYLLKMMCSNIVDYCIPRSRILSAFSNSRNSSSDMMDLRQEAVSLFSSIKTSGEGGEILLYTLAEGILGLPQLLCKMPLKTHPDVHYHGIDGVHMGLAPNGNLCLYWGESKLRTDLGNALTDAFNSIRPFFIQNLNFRGSPDRDLMLIRDNIDLVDERLGNAILDFLDPESESFNQMEARSIILVGFDEKDYPTLPNQRNENEFRKLLESKITEIKNKVVYRLERFSLHTIHIELICIPFQSVKSFKEAFVKEIGL